MLQHINHKLRQITAKYLEPLVAMYAVLCGNLRELPPVCASEVDKRVNNISSVEVTEVPWHSLAFFPLMQVVWLNNVSYARTVDNN